jgi:hypothetical protein
VTITLTDAQRTVLATGLPGLDLPAVPVTPAELLALTGWASGERLDGLLWQAVSAGDLLLDDGDPASAQAAREAVMGANVNGLRISLAAEATALDAIGVLRAAGVEPYLFKGLATSHLDHPDPAWRTFFDADLVVPRPAFLHAIDALLAAGYAREVPALRRYFDARYARAVVLRAPSGIEVDLHAAVAEGYFGIKLDHARLRQHPATVSLGGEVCSAFSPAARLVCSCYAIVLSRGPGLRLRRDLAQQLSTGGEEALLAACEIVGEEGTPVIAEALRRMLDVIAIPGVDGWLPDVTPTRRGTKALRYAELAKTKGWSADGRSALLALWPLDKVRFMWAVLRPSATKTTD